MSQREVRALIRNQISALCRTRVAIWAAATLIMTGFFLLVTLPDLGRYPRVHGDETWVMSASYKLATTGVFGSEMYRDFYGADQHYFIVLPVHPHLQALSFTVFGTGIAQARLVTVVSAVVVLWAATWLAWRWYGLVASILTGVLLLALRVNLVDLWPGLPLVSVARSARYDTTAVAFTWLTVVFLDLTIQHGSRRSWMAYAAGICAGLATLSQFFGAFTIIVVSALLLWRGRKRLLSNDALIHIGAGWSIVVWPYLLYVGIHWSDFRGQSALIAGRTDFDRPMFYLNNLRDEAGRYGHLIDPERITGSGAAPWFFVVAIWPVLGWLAWRARRPGQPGDRVLLTTILVCGITLALIDSTNVPIYTIVLWPGCCIALAAAVASGLEWAYRGFRTDQYIFRRPIPVLAGLAVLTVAVAVVADGVDAYRDDRRLAQTVSDYGEISERVDVVLPAGAGVVGHQRWWWGLHEREYLALNVLQLTWEQQAEESRQPPSFVALFDATGANTLIIDDNARSEISRYPAELRLQIETFLATETVQAAVITDPTYGRFEVHVRR